MLRSIDISKRLLLLEAVGIMMGGLLACGMLWTFQRGLADYAAANASQEDVRGLEVKFKTQVQEWKNVLLRGSDPEALAKHRDAFFAEEKAVQDGVIDLRKQLTEPASIAMLDDFAAKHQAMGVRYREALSAFAAGGGRDFASADRMVKGQDRPPAETLESIVKTQGAAAVACGTTVLTTVKRGMIVAMVLIAAFYIPFGLMLSRSITRPIGEVETALAAISDGDLSAHLDDPFNDELGRMTRSLDRAVGSLRETLRGVQDAATTVSTSSGQLSSASQSISAGAQEQASSLEETAASLEEMTSAVKQNADNAQQAAQLARGAREVAEKGGKVVGSAVEAMREINASSRKIADIITAIDEIAFQTNLLALNAAVEAARAGEQGRGFAVVAGEVRNLAQRSATAAKEIKGLINDSVERVESGSKLVDQSGATLEEIVTSVKRVTDIVAEIAASSREQSTGIEQVNTAVTQMDAVTQSNASQTEELAGTAEGLSGQAQGLMTLVQKFNLGDGGHTASYAGAPAAPAARAKAKLKVLPMRKAGVYAARKAVPVASVSAATGTDGFEEF